jgi:hypothetical protein
MFYLLGAQQIVAPAETLQQHGHLRNRQHRHRGVQRRHRRVFLGRSADMAHYRGRSQHYHSR